MDLRKSDMRWEARFALGKSSWAICILLKSTLLTGFTNNAILYESIKACGTVKGRKK